MKKTSKKTDRESTPVKPGVVVEKNAENVAETVTRSLLPTFPGIVETGNESVIQYGEQVYTFPIANNQSVQIDRALIRGKGTMRLATLKNALKIAGKENTDETRKWFNREIKDSWHKVLKFAAKDSLANGTPVSLGLSLRTTKKTGKVVLTTKHGFEHTVKPAKADAAQVEAEANKSKNRAKRQHRKAANKGANRVKAPKLANPVLNTPAINALTNGAPENNGAPAMETASK